MWRLKLLWLLFGWARYLPGVFLVIAWALFVTPTAPNVRSAGGRREAK